MPHIDGFGDSFRVAEMAAVDANDIASLREAMLRFAILQLRDRHAAEDAVQEALAAALAGRSGFAGRATIKTWVFGILRRKIVDIFRERARRAEAPPDDGDCGDFDALFDRRGMWKREDRPEDWNDPEASFENERFWQVFELCLTHLPESPGRVFMMREFIGLSTDEICGELGITANNCWVLLYRARMTLRRCLDANWFNGEAPCLDATR